MQKLDENQFWQILDANGGNFGATAKAIEKRFKISYSRQAVRQRALSKPDELNDIVESRLDDAESVMFDLLDSDDKRIKFEAARFILLTQGKSRGYTTRQELTGADGGAVQVNLTVEQWQAQANERTERAERLLREFNDDAAAEH